MAKKFQVKVVFEFDESDDGKDYIASIRDGIPGARTVHVESKTIYTHCKKCGRSRKLGTLGAGTPNEPGDECRSSHSRSCQKIAADKIKGEAQ